MNEDLFTIIVTYFRNSFIDISDNFAAQFGIILYKVYKISYDTYKDIPRGEVKVIIKFLNFLKY